jgi:hypothetical protein
MMCQAHRINEEMFTPAFVVAQHQVMIPTVPATFNVDDAIPFIQIVGCSDGILYIVILISYPHSGVSDHNRGVFTAKSVNQFPQFCF